MARDRLPPAVGAVIALLLMAGVLATGLWSGGPETPEPAASFRGLDCAARTPRVLVDVENASVAPGAAVNATVSISNPDPAPVSLHVDAVAVGVHALNRDGDLLTLAETTLAGAGPTPSGFAPLAGGETRLLDDLGAGPVTWNGTTAAGTFPGPGMYVLSVHVNPSREAPCDARVIGYQAFHVAAPEEQ